MSSLDEQILQARKKAETFARRLDVAKQADEERAEQTLHDNPTAILKHQIRDIERQVREAKAVGGSSTTADATTSSSSSSSDGARSTSSSGRGGGGAGRPPAAPAVADEAAISSRHAPQWQASQDRPRDRPHEDITSSSSLERVIRAQQSDLVKADTELRVSASRNRMLQQKVDELEKRLQEREEEDRRMSMQGHGQDVFSDRLGLLGKDGHIHMQGLRSSEYARDLEVRLEISEAKCRELLQRLAVSDAVIRNSVDSLPDAMAGDGGSGGSSSSGRLLGQQYTYSWGDKDPLPATQRELGTSTASGARTDNIGSTGPGTGTATGSVLDLDHHSEPGSVDQLRPPMHSTEPAVSRPKKKKVRPASAAAAGQETCKPPLPGLPGSRRSGSRPASAAPGKAGGSQGLRVSLEKTVRRSIKVCGILHLAPPL